MEKKRFSVNLGMLRDYRSPDGDHLPIIGCISLYQAIGLVSYLNEIKEDLPDSQIVPLDDLACNFKTMLAIKEFIKNNWATFDIVISKDCNPHWKQGSDRVQKIYVKTINMKIKRSIDQDFFAYCPGIDDNLPDNCIIYRTPEESCPTVN